MCCAFDGVNIVLKCIINICLLLVIVNTDVCEALFLKDDLYNINVDIKLSHKVILFIARLKRSGRKPAITRISPSSIIVHFDIVK